MRRTSPPRPSAAGTSSTPPASRTRGSSVLPRELLLEKRRERAKLRRLKRKGKDDYPSPLPSVKQIVEQAKKHKFKKQAALKAEGKAIREKENIKRILSPVSQQVTPPSPTTPPLPKLRPTSTVASARQAISQETPASARPSAASPPAVPATLTDSGDLANHPGLSNPHVRRAFESSTGRRNLPPPPPQVKGRIVLPNLWQPAPHQLGLWNFLEKGGTRAVAVWHRRAGKDSTSLNWTACAAHRRIGNYWHMLPEAKQGRKVVWESIDKHGRRVIDQAFPPAIRASKLEDEMLIRLKCGSSWQVVGSDNYNALVGANPVGIVFSEYSVSDPRAWDFLRPILAENGGWAVFIYTPRGHNHGEDLHTMAKNNPNWFCETLSVDDTGVVDPQIIEEERLSGMEEDMIQQEYYCSFSAAIRGSYFGKLMELAEKAGRIGRVPHDPILQVHTIWDLGINDAMAIWFVQVVGREIHLIDYMEDHSKGMDWYFAELQTKRYKYGTFVFPHDIQARELSTGKTRIETAQALMPENCEYQIIPRTLVNDQINAARLIMPRCYWDAEKCKRGIAALQQFQRDFNEKTKTFSNQPKHDWTSHGASAFMQLSLARLTSGHSIDQATGGNAGSSGNTALHDYDPLAESRAND